jgi:hypothetical protein
LTQPKIVTFAQKGARFYSIAWYSALAEIKIGTSGSADAHLLKKAS